MRCDAGAKSYKGDLHVHNSGHLVHSAPRPTGLDGGPKTDFRDTFGRHHSGLNGLLPATKVVGVANSMDIVVHA